MALIGFIFSLALLLIGMSYCGVDGRRKFSKEEDLELEKQIKILNKPFIKTMKDEAGDIFDCVEIEKQPAFDHPLLRNHKIKLDEASYPRQSNKETTSTYRKSAALLKPIGCHEGTVPIRRTQKEDLIRAQSFLELHNDTFGPLTTEIPGKHYAVVRSDPTWAKLYTGVEGYFNILNPTLQGNQQWSSSQMSIENGPPDDFNSIHVGWAVSTGVFGDNKTRLFTYWKGKGNNKGCYNFNCAGFVQVDKDHPIGRVLPTTVYDQTPTEIPLLIHQDKSTKDWWLVNLDNKSISYGYWPMELLPQLTGGALSVAWGGVTKGDVNQLSPEMGSGYFPDGVFKHTGYFVRVKVTDTSYVATDPDSFFVETYSDVRNCYDVKTYGIGKIDGYTFMYGGPGGNCSRV